MATALSRGTSATAGATATWASTANAYDGTVGTTPGTFATWVNASRSASGSIQVKGYSFAAVPAGATINSVTATINHKETSTSVISNVTVQLQDSTGANIGSAVAGTRTTSAHTDTLTLGTPTLAQVQAGLWVLVTITRSNSTTSTTFSLDYVDLTVDYTAAVTGGGGVAFDAVGVGQVLGGTVGETLSWSETIGTNPNTALLVGAHGQIQQLQSNITCTVGSSNTPLTLLDQFEYFSGGGESETLFIFGLLGPPTGAQTIKLTIPAGGSISNYFAADSASYSGVSGFGTVVRNSASTGTAMSLSVPSNPGEMVFQIFGTQGGSGGQSISAYNQTSRYSASRNLSNNFATLIGDAPGASTVNFAATAPASSEWAGSAVPLLPLTGGNPAQFFTMF